MPDQVQEQKHSDKLLLKNSALVFYHEGRLDNGAPLFFYIAVPGITLEHYRVLVQSVPSPQLDDLKRIGTILALGEGKPSAALKQRLNEQYGIKDPEVIQRLEHELHHD